jgi:hypothetical protein
MLAVCCVVAWGGVACAKEKQADKAGAGTMSCAKYAKAYQIARETDLGFLSWAQGYITGINAGMEDAYFDLGAKDPEETLRFLQKYCNDHPLAYFRDAVMELAKSLPRVKRDDAPAGR